MSTQPTAILLAIPLDDSILQRLRHQHADWELVAIDHLDDQTILPTELAERCVALVAETAPANLTAMTALRWIQISSAGYRQLEGLPLRSMGIQVTNASGVNDGPIAEWCLLMMFMFERAMLTMWQMQQDHTWDRPAKFQSELRGHRLGIIGYGNIGREVARVSKALGLDVWAMNRGPIRPTPHKFIPDGTGDPEGTLPDRTFTLDQMADFLPHLDYLVLTAALNAASHHLLGADHLRLLPRHAVILNPARGHLIEEAALARALRDGWIAGGAIDSHYREPMPPDDPVWEWPNTILTPHISGSFASPNYQSRFWQLVENNLTRFARNQPLLNQIAWSDLSAT